MASSQRDRTLRVPDADQAEIITLFTQFYRFMQSLYVPDDQVKYPPPEGWPQLTQERLTKLNKSKRVTELLKHLPYIEALGHNQETYEVVPNTGFIDYRHAGICASLDGDGEMIRYLFSDRKSYQGLDDIAEWQGYDEDTINLTTGYYDHAIFALDVKRGIMYFDKPDLAFMSATELSDKWPEGQDESTHPWRGFPALRLADFFDMLRDLYLDYRLLPCDEWGVEYLVSHETGQILNYEHKPALRRIFERHRWPTPQFDKKACMEEILNMDEYMSD